MKLAITRFALGAACCACLGAARADEPYFIGLGHLPDTDGGRAVAVSDDGAVVVGLMSAGAESRAFRWTATDGLVDLGFLSDSVHRSAALDVSGDGSVIVGTSVSDAAGGHLGDFESFRWTETDGMVGLGFIEDAGLSLKSQGTAVSADGLVIAGLCGDRVSVAFRWTEADGIVNLHDLPGGGRHASASGISADGSVVVGRGTDDVMLQAFRWTQADGMVGIGALPGHGSSQATNVSADGNVIVGWSEGGTTGAQAFRWTSIGGMIGLGDLPGGESDSVAHDVSGDGSVIVGSGSTGIGREGMIWTAGTGMLNLRQALSQDLGLDLDEWVLHSAIGVSANGRYIVGGGFNPDGLDEGWLAYLGDPIPCKGDFDGDGVRDLTDLATLLASYRLDDGGDLDGDGDTDLSDLAWMLSVFGDPCLR